MQQCSFWILDWNYLSPLLSTSQLYPAGDIGCSSYKGTTTSADFNIGTFCSKFSYLAHK
jgi:hypothetical protein